MDQPYLADPYSIFYAVDSPLLRWFVARWTKNLSVSFFVLLRARATVLFLFYTKQLEKLFLIFKTLFVRFLLCNFCFTAVFLNYGVLFLSVVFFSLFSLVRRTKNSVESNFDLLCWRLFLIGHVFHFIDFWTPTNGLDAIYSSLFVICSSTFTRSHYPRFCFCISINYRLNTNHLTAPCT